MQATFTVDAYPQERFRGKVRQIRNAPQTVQNVVTYDAVIDVDNPELKLKPGMTANVTFIYAEKNDVLRVPNAALRFRAARRADQERGEPRRGHCGQRDPAPAVRPVASRRERPRRAVGASGAAAASVRAEGRAARRGGRRRAARAEPDHAHGLGARGAGIRARCAFAVGITDGTLTEIVEGELQRGRRADHRVDRRGRRAQGHDRRAPGRRRAWRRRHAASLLRGRR